MLGSLSGLSEENALGFGEGFFHIYTFLKCAFEQVSFCLHTRNGILNIKIFIDSPFLISSQCSGMETVAPTFGLSE